jgi:signal transduction histidine kinase
MKQFRAFLKKFGLDQNIIYPLTLTLVVMIFLLQHSFHAYEASFYDLWSKFDFLTRSKNNYAAIYMDESTDQFLGEVYPYSYATHTKLLKNLLRDNPKAIFYFLDFKEPITEDEKKHYENFIQLLSEAKSKIPIRLATSMDIWGEQLPPEKLQRFGYSLGLINEESEDYAQDSVSRKIILNVSGEDTIHLWAANELRKNTNDKLLDAKFISGSYYDGIADATFAYYRFPVNPLNQENKSLVVLPINRVVGDNIRPDYFKEKIVLVGHQYLSRPDDYALTPFSKEDKSSKLVLHASMIEALFQDKTVTIIPIVITGTLTLFLVLFLSIVISKTNPMRGIIFIVCSALVFVILAYLVFVFLGLWLKVIHLIFAVTLVYYIWVPFRAIAEYQKSYAIQEETKLRKKVDGLKQNFISLMSHDLKTPVAKISGLADNILLKLDPQNVEMKKNMLQLMDATQELNSFISAILDLTKIESQNIKLNLQSKDINSIINQIVEKLQDLAFDRQMQIETELAPLYPITIDQLLIHRVISNLVENAIKYAASGKKILIKTWDDAAYVYVQVQDYGQGIPSEELLNIFEKFYRVKNDSSHQIKGTGLGLYLVKYFIELHQGEITVDSTLGQGTTFTIKLLNK